MANFCKNCGKEIVDAIAFCTECGTPVPADKENLPVEVNPEIAALPVYQQRQTYQQPYAQQKIKPKCSKYEVLSTGAFFGLMFLFSIPIIGWISCIIMAFAPRNENLKHFARAMLIWLIIAAVLCVALCFLFLWIGDGLKDYINKITDGQFSNWKDIFEQFKNGNLTEFPI